MVLAQDLAQANPSLQYQQRKEANKEYVKKLEEYEKDTAKYEKDLADYQAEIERIEKEKQTEIDKKEIVKVQRQEIQNTYQIKYDKARSDYKNVLANLPTTKTTTQWNSFENKWVTSTVPISSGQQQIERNKALGYFIDIQDSIKSQHRQSIDMFDYQQKYGGRTLTNNEYKRWLSGTTTLVNVIDASIQTAEGRRIKAWNTSIASARANAIIAANLYSSNPSSFSASIQNFGATKLRTFSKAEIERRAAIKPQPVKRTPSVFSANLTQAIKREPYTGVKFYAPPKPVRSDYSVMLGAVPIPTTNNTLTKIDGSYIGFSPSGLPYQGAVRPEGYVVDYGGKERTFLTLASAEKFIDRVSKSTTSSTPIGFLGELESSLRYSDRVDLGDVPKPSDASGLIQYYASHGLKGFADIGYTLKNIITGDDEPIAPSLPSVLFEQGFEVAKKIWETGDWTPNVENKAGKYFMDDPVRSIVQLPAEAALWITGGKAISLGIKAGQKVAGKFGITNPVARISSSVEGKTIYRGISIQRKPIIGIQQGKIIVGEPKPVVPQLSKASLESRSGGELALGYGAERSLFYTEKGLGQQVKAGLINPLSKERVLAAAKLEDATQAAKGGQYKGTIGADSFKSVTEDQGKFLLTKTAALQKKGQVDIVHGSIATRIAIEPSLKAESGNILRMGDLDINPMRLSKKEIATASKITKEEKIQGITKETKIKTLEKEKAIDVAKQYEDFPVRIGETFSIKIPKGEGNIGLQLAKQGEPPRKIGEIILLKSEEAIQKGKGDPTSILSYRIPFDKTQTARDFKIKTQTMEFQGLTQTKTTLAYQTYSPTAKLASDIPARAKIYPAAGREKDVLRRYWQGRQSELNQIRSGKPIAATATRTAAEDFRKLYPELDFNVVPEEKFVLKLSSQITESSSTPKILVAPTIGGRATIETSRTKIEPRSNINSRVQIKPREQSISIKSKQQDSFISKRIESSKSKSIFEEDSSLELYSSYKQSQSIGSSKPQSIGSKASSFLQSFTSRKPISAKSKVPVSSKPSVTSRPSQRPSIRPSLRAKLSSRISNKASVQSGIPIAIRVPKKSVVPIIMALKSTEKKRKKKEKGQKDFLGNTRTDRFVGLINRKEILVGDKLTARQIKLDKKLTMNPSPPRSKKQTKKRDSDISIAKGFKI